MSKLYGKAPSYGNSQNFLTSRALIEKLIRRAKLVNTDTVLEIGAGKGHITRCLAAHCKRVIAYEIDGRLYEKTKAGLAANVRLLHADFLSASLPKTPYKVFANIPFSQTGAILHKLTSCQPLPQGLWLVMEKGAAKRFCGLPCENLHALLLKPWFQARITYFFRREDFHPAPGVDVVLLEMTPKEPADLPPIQRAAFQAFLTHCLKRGLFGPGAPLTKAQVRAALRQAKLAPLAPGGQVHYIQWLCLFRCWLRSGKRLP